MFILLTSQGADSQQVNLHLTTVSPTASTSSTPVQSYTSSISGKIDCFLEMQLRLMQQMVCPNSDHMKEVFIDYVHESVYEVHSSLWASMQQDLMKTAMLYKDKDREMK